MFQFPFPANCGPTELDPPHYRNLHWEQKDIKEKTEVHVRKKTVN